MEINAYSSAYAAGSTNKTGSKDTAEPKIDDGGLLGMNDFLNLLIAQLTNQDPMNPTENTEFIAQLAQFSSLQAMSEMTASTRNMQATSLIGKNVVAAEYDIRGHIVQTEGKVDKVTIHSGETLIYIGDKAFSLSNIMEVKGEEVKNSEE